jgi:hypothetical protein
VISVLRSQTLIRRFSGVNGDAAVKYSSSPIYRHITESGLVIFEDVDVRDHQHPPSAPTLCGRDPD